MNTLDRILEGLRWRLWESTPGIFLWHALGWVASRIAPYTPPRAEIPEERARAFVRVEVRPSTIPGAGQGLFSMERIEAGVRIGEYTGDIVHGVFNVLRLRDKDFVARTADPSVCIDALRRPEVMTRYICHHPGEGKRNVRFRNEGSRKFVETTRAVHPGEELLADYGDMYWRLKGVTPSGN
ncbi:MAG: hypothetical protein HZB33_07085 [Nitrospirae bacterium]|nr:hypothetical protein [Nitrospirota bacterium]